MLLKTTLWTLAWSQPGSLPSRASRTSKRAFPVGSMKSLEKSLSSMERGRTSLEAEQKASSLTGAFARWSVSMTTIQFWGSAAMAALSLLTASGTSCGPRGSSPQEQHTHRLPGSVQGTSPPLSTSSRRSTGRTAKRLRSMGFSPLASAPEDAFAGGLDGENGFQPPKRPETWASSSVIPPCFPVARARNRPSTRSSFEVPSSAVCAPRDAASNDGRLVPPHNMVVKSE
mmetsp:Transcript_353/g.1433  ORF Transcript_353/g.1433 Transcript_353/m.1433 type:complete len:229 (+) Transcript_353:1812-2498(+)